MNPRDYTAALLDDLVYRPLTVEVYTYDGRFISEGEARKLDVLNEALAADRALDAAREAVDAARQALEAAEDARTRAHVAQERAWHMVYAFR